MVAGSKIVQHAGKLSLALHEVGYLIFENIFLVVYAVKELNCSMSSERLFGGGGAMQSYLGCDKQEMGAFERIE